MSPALKRVCYIIPSLGIGGTERQLLQLMRDLIRDHEITVVCTRSEGALAADARRLGAVVRLVRAYTGWDFTLTGKLTRLFRNHRPDVVHTFLFGFDYFANVAARRAGTPIVVSSRRQLATWKKPRHIRLQRRANRRVDAIVANSNAVAGFAAEQEGMPRDFYRVIRNGIEPDAFISSANPHEIRQRYKIPFNTRVIGIVANFSPVKDHMLFLDIAAELNRRRPDLHFLLVGDGPLRKPIDLEIHNRLLDDYTTMLSAIRDLPDLYRLMSTSVLCSKVEGFPNTVIESMAAETPVVAAAVGGVPELIEDGVTGRLVPTRNPGDFANAVESLLDNPEETAAMTSRAARFVRNELPIEKAVDAYRKLYAELLARTVQKGG